MGVVGHADHMQVQVQQQDQGDHGDLPSIHIAVDNMGDGNVPIATGVPTPTLPTTRPERRRHGMGHVVGDGDVSTHRHAAVPGTYGHGLSGPATTGAARAELGMSRDRNVQPHHHYGAIRQRPAVRSPTNTASDSGPSPTTTGTATAANNFGILQQQQQQQDPMNASQLSFHIQSTTTSPSSASSLTTEQRRAREQQQQQQQPRFVLSRRRVDTVTSISGSSSTTISSTTTTSASLTPSQRAMVQAQLHLQEVPPNVVMPVNAGGHHQHQHQNHQHMLRNQYQTQTQTQAGSSSSSVVGDWSMGSLVHTPLSSSSSSSSSAAAALVSRLESSPSLSSSRRQHRMVNPITRSPPLPVLPLSTVSSGSRQRAYRRQGTGHDGNEDRVEDEGDEYDCEEQEGLGDDDMVLG